ncbi:hypothetical protein [Nocardiopsis synnemataformans]|uniref:hypothetical protein n=1 Tax=Nocardiopsis synnemataformans TaxID=61305 RepID=UPI003EB95001
MTAYLITWRDPGGEHATKRDTWSEAIGLEAAHWAENPHLEIVDPRVDACLHCHATITQALTPGRWNDRFGDDMCTNPVARWHEPPTRGWLR